MYSSILVVGGGLLFHRAQEFLQHRILNKMPPSFRRVVESVEVITRPKVHWLLRTLASLQWTNLVLRYAEDQVFISSLTQWV